MKTDEEELEELMAEALAERDSGEFEDEEDEDEFEEEDQDESEDDDKEEEESDESEEGEEDDDSADEDDTDDGESEESGEDEKSGNDFSPIEVNIAGGKVTINSKEEMMAYIQKGAKAFEAQEDTSFKKEKLIIEQAKLSDEDLMLIAEVKKGSKEALAKLAKSSNIDLLEVSDTDADNYKQTIEYKEASEVDKIASEILSDKDHADKFRSVVAQVPQEFISAVSGNAEALRMFNEHIKAGLAQEIIPLARHAMNVKGGNFMQHYAEIGQKIYDSKNQKQEESKQEEKQERQVSQKEKDLRKRASSKKGVSGKKTEAETEDDIFNLSDEEFIELQRNLRG